MSLSEMYSHLRTKVRINKYSIHVHWVIEQILPSFAQNQCTCALSLSHCFVCNFTIRLCWPVCVLLLLTLLWEIVTCLSHGFISIFSFALMLWLCLVPYLYWKLNMFSSFVIIIMALRYPLFANKCSNIDGSKWGDQKDEKLYANINDGIFLVTFVLTTAKKCILMIIYVNSKRKEALHNIR